MPIPLGVLAVAGAGAAGGGASYDLLETTVISSNATSVTFSNLNTYSDYKHLQLRLVLRSQRVNTTSALQVRFNGVSTTSYAYHRLYGNGNILAQGQPNTSAASFYSYPASQLTSNAFSATVIDILDFSNTSKNTTIRALHGYAASGNWIGLESGFWNNTAAVTSISLIDWDGQNFVNGSRFSLYGIK
jgi:hypothetical protein